MSSEHPTDVSSNDLNDESPEAPADTADGLVDSGLIDLEERKNARSTTPAEERSRCRDCHSTSIHTTSNGVYCKNCGELNDEALEPQDEAYPELVTDGGVPRSFEDLAGTCESCGDSVDPQRLVNGECPGCAYGEPMTDGGVDSSERFHELLERGRSEAESGEPEFRWSRVKGVWTYEGDEDRAEELLQEIVDADGPTAETAQEALDVLTSSGREEDGGARPLTTDWWHLTGFQRDILRILGREGGMYGLAIKRELQDRYDEEINHGRLYPNLDDLVDNGTIVKSELDKRTNLYELTADGEGLVSGQQEAWSELDLDAEPVQQPPAGSPGDSESAAATDGGSAAASVTSEEPTLDPDDRTNDDTEDEEVVIDPYEVFDESPMPARIDLPDVLDVVCDSSTVFDAAAELNVSSEKLATLFWDLGLKKPQTKVIVDDPEDRVAELREMMDGGDR